MTSWQRYDEGRIDISAFLKAAGLRYFQRATKINIYRFLFFLFIQYLLKVFCSCLYIYCNFPLRRY